MRWCHRRLRNDELGAVITASPRRTAAHTRAPSGPRSSGQGRTVKEVAGNFPVTGTGDDAVTTRHALLERTSNASINHRARLDETSFVRRAVITPVNLTTVADVANHQIIDILPTRNFVDVASFMANKRGLRQRVTYGASTCRHLRRGLQRDAPQRAKSSTAFT